MEQKHEWKFDDWKGERRKESGREGRGQERARGERRDKELERTSLRRFGGTNAHVDAAGTQSCPANFLLHLVILLDFAKLWCHLKLNLSSGQLVSVRRSLLSPTARPCIHRETKSTQDVGTGAAVKTIDDVECRVRDGKSAIGRTWDGVFAKSLRTRRGRESWREGPTSSTTHVFFATDIRFTLSRPIVRFSGRNF